MNRTNTDARYIGFYYTSCRCPCRSILSHAHGEGCDRKFSNGVTSSHSSMLLHHSCLSATTRCDRAEPEVRGKTGATPSVLPFYRHQARGGVTGGVTHPVPPFWGSLPSKLSLREGPEPEPSSRR